MTRIRYLVLGVNKLNQPQLKAVSKLYLNLGTLLIGSAVVKFFVPTDKTPINFLTMTSGTLLALLFFIWGIRVLEEVKDK